MNAVTAAYYPRLVTSPEAARGRAQAAYTIASAVAAGLVVTGLLTSLDRRPIVVQVLGLASFLAWVCTAAAYVRAVAVPVNLPRPDDSKLDTDGFVKHVLEVAKEERDKIDGYQKKANWVAASAAWITAVTFIVAVALPTAQPRLPATLALTDTGSQALKNLCNHPVLRLSGWVDRTSLDMEVVVFSVPAGGCGPSTMTLRLPRADVAAISTP